MRISENTVWIKLGIDSLFDNPLPNISLENINFYASENNIIWINTSVDESNNELVIYSKG